MRLPSHPTLGILHRAAVASQHSFARHPAERAPPALTFNADSSCIAARTYIHHVETVKCIGFLLLSAMLGGLPCFCCISHFTVICLVHITRFVTALQKTRAGCLQSHNATAFFRTCLCFFQTFKFSFLTFLFLVLHDPSLSSIT